MSAVRLTLALLTLCLPGITAARADPPAPLAEGAGRSLTVKTCSVCHDTDYIVMNSPFLTEDGWKSEIAKMRAAFGARIDPATASAIAAYLAAHYSAHDTAPRQ